MSDIALYNLLKRIPDATDTEIKEVVADIATSKGIATKSDITELKASTKSDITELKASTKSDITELKASTKSDIKGMATKADIKELKEETKADIKNMATKADIKDMATQDYIDAKIEKMERVLIMWMIGVGLAVVGLIKYV